MVGGEWVCTKCSRKPSRKASTLRMGRHFGNPHQERPAIICLHREGCPAVAGDDRPDVGETDRLGSTRMAVLLARELYEDAPVALRRKQQLAEEILAA